ncbi:uncharacterized protein TRIADDRAFT_56943 [Trichoplax adhaerens]|uniref:Sema domain-containing protein n=1 Tax=Trichoplax adhaerens TaxID=10228 RepID=B3RWZ9_TRIAD|nr:hypothetical protein TRIADDRAFT_56943 [Trichoplax adhaerens]EDV25223.1 hypothetical protein TRIADDRAFT_56943 [Trichoplax adhaerens]|eukprot:XP_002113113.1 hypothetical protein TRIADDRAFT_56943 [Trichoplax adhaerens]
MFNNICWVLLLSSIGIACGQTPTATYTSPNVNSVTFQNMDLDESAGRIYIGAKNAIYLLNSTTLTILTSASTGPVQDSPYCAPLPDSCSSSRNLSDNYNKILIADTSGQRLIVCGSVNQGRCRIRQLNNLALITNTVQPSYFVAANQPSASTLAFVGSGVPNTTKVLYVGVQYTQRSFFSSAVPALAARSLYHQSSQSDLLNYANLLPSESNIKFTDRSYEVQYINGFSHGGYTYFATVQKAVTLTSTTASIANNYISKLIRLCNGPNQFQSYVETPLECRGANSRIYNLLQAAYLTKPGSSLATSLQVSTSSDILIGVFSASNETNSRFPSTDAAVCIYTMQSVSSVFSTNINNCYGSQILVGLPYIVNPTARCQVSQVPQCSSQTNPAIGGSQSIYGQALLELKQHIITSIIATPVRSNTVVFLGTNSGHILKLRVNSATSASQYQDLTIDQNYPIISMKYTKNKNSIYTLSTTKLVLIPVHDCNTHKNCDNCMNSKDPYCGWCTIANKCTSRSGCFTSNEAFWTQSGTTARCVDLSLVVPASAPVGRVTSLKVNVANLPTNTQYQCRFGSYGTTDAAQLVDGVRCNTPSSNLLPSILGPQGVGCPALLNTTVLLSIGTRRNFNLNARNLQPIPSGNVGYECLLNVDGTQLVLLGRRIASNSLECIAPLQPYNYGKSVESIQANLQIRYLGRLLIYNEGNVTVTLYNCRFGRSDCSVCLAAKQTKGYDCGWCQYPSQSLQSSICTHVQQCSFPGNIQSQSCPGPNINSVMPLRGPIEGGTVINITGTNLGIQFSDITRITVAGLNCKPLRDGYVVSYSIYCNTSASSSDIQGQVTVNIRGVSASYIRNWQYVRTSVSSIYPLKGPESGGTNVKITGQNLNAGLTAKVIIADKACNITKRTATVIECLTSQTNVTGSSQSSKRSIMKRDITSSVTVQIDAAVITSAQKFTYTEDPTFVAMYPNRAFPAGGLNLTVYGTNLDSVISPRIIISTGVQQQTTASSICNNNFPNGAMMRCPFPNITELSNGLNSFTAYISLIMDGVTSLKQLYIYNEEGSKLYYTPNPSINAFANDEASVGSNLILTMTGTNLNRAANTTDYNILIGGQKCAVSTLNQTHLTCTTTQLQSKIVQVTVTVGNLIFRPGKVQFFSAEQQIRTTIIIAVTTSVAIILVIIIPLIFLYRRKSAQNRRTKETLQTRLDRMESQVALECKTAFAELQTDVSEYLKSDLSNFSIPYLPFNGYAIKILFPDNEEYAVHHFLNQREGRRYDDDDAVLLFADLLYKKKFLKIYLHTIENQQDFSMKDRCNVASLLMVALQHRMGYVTEILCHLLRELIHKSVAKNHPKLILRRTECIAEKLLTNWLSFFFYPYLFGSIGDSLYVLYQAIKQQVDKGPVDEITADAKHSLSEDKLIRQNIDYQTLTLSAHFERTTELVKVLDCDSITQTKEKILDAIYKSAAYSRRTPAEEIDLEWIRDTPSGLVRIILKNEDDSSNISGRWKRINTLKHYQIPDGASVVVIPRTSASSLSVSSNSSTRYPVSSRSLLGRLSVDENGETHYNLWHLIKPMDENSTDPNANKLVSEVFLTRLLSTKHILQTFVDDLFSQMFTVPQTLYHFPKVIKYLFDFLDYEAFKLGFTTENDVAHTWKNNCLPLRFYINIVKNPHHAFDVNKSGTVDSCLSVIAQAFMDSCSITDNRLGKDSPSNKLLYARETSDYKARVQKFYADIQYMPPVSLDELLHTHEDMMRRFRVKRNFNSLNAVHELFTYATKYITELRLALEDAGMPSLADKLALLIKKSKYESEC